MIWPKMSMLLSLRPQLDMSPLLYCHLSQSFKDSCFFTVSFKRAIFLLILLLMLILKMTFFLNVKIIHAHFREFRILRTFLKNQFYHTEVTSKNILLFGAFSMLPEIH